MTALQLYDACLVELNKVDAPNVLLEEWNYLANKAINNHINKRYNIYDINQQTTDDLRVLKASAILPVKKVNDYKELGFMEATYEVILPSDYLHILNCMCIYEVHLKYKCYTPGTLTRFPATRLTADLFSQVTDNYWNRATYKKPYYYIHNVNKYITNPTNPYKYTEEDFSDSDENNDITRLTGTDIYLDESDVNNNSLPKTISLRKEDGTVKNYSNVERTAGVRYGNVSEVRMEIRYGTDDLSVFKLKKVLIDYIKTPLYILLTQEQLDRVEDTSLMLEFPDYVCQEIVNELVHIIMERNSDPRLQTHPVVTLSIANPAQQLTVQPAAAAAQ